MAFFGKIARAVFGNPKPVPAKNADAVPQGDANVERITHPRWYARARPHRRSYFVPNNLAPILTYLKQAHGLDIAEVYLENHKSPEITIVLDGPLPIAKIVSQFPPNEDLKYTATEFWSVSAFTSVQGMSCSQASDGK